MKHKKRAKKGMRSKTKGKDECQTEIKEYNLK